MDFQSRLRSWGAGLSEDQLAKAVAASGLISYERGALESVEKVLDVETKDEDSVITLPWVPRLKEDPLACAESWKIVLPRIKVGLRIEAYGTRGGDAPAHEVVDLLNRAIEKRGTIVVPLGPTRAIRDVSWPIRVGVLPGSTAGDELALPWMKDIVRPVLLGPGRSSCDMLIVEADARTALHRILSARAPIRAGIVVLLGGRAGLSPDTESYVEALRNAVHAGAVTLMGRRPSSDGMVSRLLAELAHDETLDQAVFAAAQVGAKDEAPLIFAETQLLDRVRVTDVARRAEEQLAASAVGAVDAVRLDELRKVLERLTGAEASFYREAEGASEVSRTIEDARARVVLSQPRWLQARVRESEAGPDLEVFLRPASAYLVQVRVGPESKDWIAGKTGFPDAELPRDPVGHELLVVFMEWGKAPQAGKLFLPPEGPSSLCSFSLQTGPSGVDLDARIAVLHEKRVLQMARLRAPVSSEERAGARLELIIEAEIRPGCVDLDSRRPFDAALVVDQEPTTPARLLALIADRSETFSLGDLDRDGALGEIKKLLGGVAKNPEQYRPLESPAALALLQKLAHQGALLHGALRDRLSEILEARTIQVVSATPEAFVPLELAYDRPAPEAAKLCPNLPEAMKAGECPSSCARDGKTLCPLGFWGLSRVIERHVHVREVARAVKKAGGDFAVFAEPTRGRARIEIAAGALFGSSNRVDAVEDSSKRVLDALKQLCGSDQGHVHAWEEWVAGVGERSPPLLVLVPHIERDATLGVLAAEIGAAAKLPVTLVKTAHVRRDGSVSPLVMLVGCSTALADLSYSGFVTAFRRNGAGIVLSTLAPVAGREAAKVVAELIQQFGALPAGDGMPFGEVLTRVRRDMVARGISMMALTLVAYGDADWQLEGKAR